MSVLIPIAASILGASSFVIDKITMSIKRVTYKTYNVISFPLIFFFTLIAFFIFKPSITTLGFTGKYLPLFIVSILLVIVANLIFYRALKSDSLAEIQTIGLLSKVPAIIFAGIFFIDERNYFIMFLATLAAASVVWAHWERHHFHIAKKTWPLLIYILAVSPFSGIMIKTLLEVWHPIALELVTDGIIALIFIPLFFKNIMKTPKAAILPLLATNLLAAIAAILLLFSIQILGLVQSILIFSIQPLLIYFASLFYLKEKLHWKKAVSFAIILITIILSQIV